MSKRKSELVCFTCRFCAHKRATPIKPIRRASGCELSQLDLVPLACSSSSSANWLLIRQCWRLWRSGASERELKGPPTGSVGRRLFASAGAGAVAATCLQLQSSCASTECASVSRAAAICTRRHKISLALSLVHHSLPLFALQKQFNCENMPRN